MPVEISDDQLEAHGERVKGSVVIITGGGSGIGQSSAYKFASKGARVVVSDVNLASAQATVDVITSSGGEAVAVKCDVRSFEEQLSMFKLAVTSFGSVDVVVANAGVVDGGRLNTPELKDGLVVKPPSLVLDVNLTGALYTIYLAQHYLSTGHSSESVKPKSLIVISSMSAFYSLVGVSMYVSAKLGLVGTLKSLHTPLATKGVRMSLVNPWFSPTPLMNEGFHALLAGIALTPTSRIASAILNAASDTDINTTGSAYVLMDDGPVHVFSQKELNSPDLYTALGRACNIDDKLKPTGGAQVTEKLSADSLRVDGGRFKDAVVFILGASNIGRATALSFAQKGAKIVIVDHNATILDEVAGELQAIGREVLSVKIDIGSFDEQQGAFKIAIDRFGSVDVVVIAVEEDDDQSFSLPDSTQNEIGKPNVTTINNHVFGAAYCMHLAFHYFSLGGTPKNSRPKAVIIVAAPSTYQAIPGSTLYTTAKFAQLGIVRCLDRLVARAGINTAVVSPSLPSGMAPAALAEVIVYAANEANLSKAGAGYFLSEDGDGSVRVAMQDTVREGGYGELDARLDKISGLPSLMPR